MDHEYLEVVSQILTVNYSDVFLKLEYHPTPSCMSFIAPEKRGKNPTALSFCICSKID